MAPGTCRCSAWRGATALLPLHCPPPTCKRCSQRQKKRPARQGLEGEVLHLKLDDFQGRAVNLLKANYCPDDHPG